MMPGAGMPGTSSDGHGPRTHALAGGGIRVGPDPGERLTFQPEGPGDLAHDLRGGCGTHRHDVAIPPVLADHPGARAAERGGPFPRTRVAGRERVIRVR